MICFNCGAGLEPGAKACPRCGQPVPGVYTRRPAPTPTPPPAAPVPPSQDPSTSPWRTASQLQSLQSPTVPPRQPAPPTRPTPVPPPTPPQQQRTSPLAVASAILFGVSLLIINPFGLLSIVGLICAIVDLVQNSEQGNTSGRNLSIVLIICHCLGFAWFVVQFFFWQVVFGLFF